MPSFTFLWLIVPGFPRLSIVHHQVPNVANSISRWPMSDRLERAFLVWLRLRWQIPGIWSSFGIFQWTLALVDLTQLAWEGDISVRRRWTYPDFLMGSSHLPGMSDEKGILPAMRKMIGQVWVCAPLTQWSLFRELEWKMDQTTCPAIWNNSTLPLC